MPAVPEATLSADQQREAGYLTRAGYRNLRVLPGGKLAGLRVEDGVYWLYVGLAWDAKVIFDRCEQHAKLAEALAALEVLGGSGGYC